jgi:hypothetical protein
MVQVSRSVALRAAAVAASAALIHAAPLRYNPYTPIDFTLPLTASHPAFGGKVSEDCVKPIIPKDPNQAKAESMTITGPIYRKLRNMEDASNTDIADLEKFFGTSMELNFNTLKEQYSSASASSAPWASSYWPTYQDSINYVWKTGEASASEKYATAFDLDVTEFKDKVSASTGIDKNKGNKECLSNADCASTNDGSRCAVRDGAATGYCIPAWWGICHAWAPAAILEDEPQCDVEKNGVTFHVFDIKALVTDLYAGASLKTVFTGARFYGPDSPEDKDQYGRFSSAERRDVGPGYFHIAITNVMGKHQQSFVVDVTAGAEVWNQPVRSYEVQEMELMDAAEASQQYFGTPTYPFNDEMVFLAYAKTTFRWIGESYDDGPLVSTGKIDEFTESADYEYLLELDANYNIIGGEWVGQSKEEHPDFLWFPTAKPAESVVTSAGLSYANVKELLALSISCNSSTNAPTQTPTIAPTETPTLASTETPSTATPSSSSGSDGIHTETLEPAAAPSGSGGSGIFIPITAAPAGDYDTPQSTSDGLGVFIPIISTFTTGSQEGTSGTNEGNVVGKPTTPPSSTSETATSPSDGKPTPSPETPSNPPSGNPTPSPTTPIGDNPSPVPEVTPVPSSPTPDYPVTPSTPENPPNGKPTPAPTSPEVTPAPTEPTVHFVC